jgi:signal transduction histidine kinase
MSEQKRAEAIALESRMIEETRIARELNDTLLQNLQGLMFQFQAARNLATRHPDEALRSLNAAINEGEKALDESRDAMQDLGSEHEEGSRGIGTNETARNNPRSKSSKAEK